DHPSTWDRNAGLGEQVLGLELVQLHNRSSITRARSGARLRQAETSTRYEASTGLDSTATNARRRAPGCAAGPELSVAQATDRAAAESQRQVRTRPHPPLRTQTQMEMTH